MRVLIGLASAVALLLTTGVANAEWQKTDVPEFGFSAMFPAAPKREQNTDHGVQLTSYVAIADGALCIVMHGLYPYTVNPDVEIPASRDNFVKGVSAKLLSEKPLEFPRGSKKLRALEFDAKGAMYTFRSILIIEGAHVYQIAGGTPNKDGKQSDLESCVRGLKLTPT